MVLEFSTFLVTIARDMFLILSAPSSLKKPFYGENKILNNHQLA